MTTKINGGAVDSHAPVTRTVMPIASRSDGKPARPAAATGDSLSLTPDALLMQQAANAAGDASGIDAGRVASVSAELANGSYRIDPQAIAARMMKSEWELYG
jgi:negative regulator of flagellin synthesis FlgM